MGRSSRGRGRAVYLSTEQVHVLGCMVLAHVRVRDMRLALFRDPLDPGTVQTAQWRRPSRTAALLTRAYAGERTPFRVQAQNRDEQAVAHLYYAAVHLSNAPRDHAPSRLFPYPDKAPEGSHTR